MIKYILYITYAAEYHGLSHCQHTEDIRQCLVLGLEVVTSHVELSNVRERFVLSSQADDYRVFDDLAGEFDDWAFVGR